MKIQLTELTKLIEGSLEGDGAVVITGAAGLEEAGPGDITFLGNQKYLPLVAKTKAAAVIVPENYKGDSKAVIRAKNPQLFFCQGAGVDRQGSAVIASTWYRC